MEYDNIMHDQLKNGIIEKVHQPWFSTEKIHYLPHPPVYKSDSLNTKLRIVTDSSAHTKDQPSLNDCLLRGVVFAGQQEKQIASLSLLIRFRFYGNVLIGDLEKAFLQISIRHRDRDSTRMLWPANPMLNDNPEVFRFCRVAFGIKSSPFLLGATLTHHLKNHPSELA